jgi:endonuclease/exonuclease/phosphatase family metal-dependent hydrolase
MEVKFLTLNLWHGGKLMDAILDFLEEQAADILVMQEVNNGSDPSLEPRYRSVEVLQERLHFPYADFVPDFLDLDISNTRVQRGNLILSKFPIKKTDAIYFDGAYSETYQDVPGNYQNCPRSLQHALLETPAGEVNVFNLQGVWDLAGDHFGPKRERMCRAILEATQGKPNVILAGDSNATPGNQAIKLIEDRLNNVFKGSLKTTFNMRQKTNPGYATAVVDVIFTSPEIQVLEKACPDVDVSDHLPLTAVLRIPTRAESS